MRWQNGGNNTLIQRSILSLKCLWWAIPASPCNSLAFPPWQAYITAESSQLTLEYYIPVCSIIVAWHGMAYDTAASFDLLFLFLLPPFSTYPRLSDLHRETQQSLAGWRPSQGPLTLHVAHVHLLAQSMNYVCAIKFIDTNVCMNCALMTCVCRDLYMQVQLILP